MRRRLPKLGSRPCKLYSMKKASRLPLMCSPSTHHSSNISIFRLLCDVGCCFAFGQSPWHWTRLLLPTLVQLLNLHPPLR